MADSLVWWPFLLGVICNLVAKQRLSPSQKLGEENYPQFSVGTNPNAKSLVLASCFAFFSPGSLWYLVCTLAGWSVACFGFPWFLTPQLLPGSLVIPCPTFLPEDTAWVVFQTVMEKVESLFIYITRSAGNFSGTFVLLDSPWDHQNQPTMPCQGKAGAWGLHHPHCYIAQTFPGMVLTHSNEPRAQAQLAQALTLARDHSQSAVWMQPLCIGGARV